MKKNQMTICSLALAVLAQSVPAMAAGGQPQAARVKVKDRAAASLAVAELQAAPAEQAGSKQPDEAPVAAAATSAVDAGHGQASAAEPAADATAVANPTSAASAASACEPPFKTEIAALFDRWNAALRSKDPKKVVANYAPGSVLIPTLSDRVRFTATEKEDYFVHFLKRHPEGRIDDRVIEVDCNSAVDSGLYTFRFGDGTQVRARYTFTYKRLDGEWLISSHHSSVMPEKPAQAAAPGVKAAAGMPDAPKPWVRFP